MLSGYIIGTSPAAAYWKISIDNSDCDNVFDIWFLTDDVHYIYNYELEFSYDTGEMNYTSYTNTPPASLTPDMMGNMEDKGSGYLHNFNAAYLVGNPAIVSSDVKLATITFDILPDAVADGEPDLLFNISPFFGITIDGSTAYYNRDYFLDPTFASEHLSYGNCLDVGSVPVPGAIWLLVSGVIGLIGIRRKSS